MSMGFRKLVWRAISLVAAILFAILMTILTSSCAGTPMPAGAGPLPGGYTVEGVRMVIEQYPFTGVTVNEAKDIWVLWWKLELNQAGSIVGTQPAWGIFIADIQNGVALKPIDIVQKGMWTPQATLVDFLKSLAAQGYRPANPRDIPLQIQQTSNLTNMMWWEIMTTHLPTYLFIIDGAGMPDPTNPCWVFETMGYPCPQPIDG